MEQNRQIRDKETFWGNVRKLVQINFLQQRNVLWGCLISVICYTIVQTLYLIAEFQSPEEWGCYSVIRGHSAFVWMGFMFLLFPVSAVFTNESISMYPGNTMTRFVSRVISDHIILFLYAAVIGGMYLAQSLLLRTVLRRIGGVRIEVGVDFRYLGAGLAYIVVIWLVLYTALVLLMAGQAILGGRILLNVVLILAGIGIVLYLGVNPVQPIVKQWLGSHNLFLYTGGCLFLWLAGLIAAGILAKHIHSWKGSREASFLGTAVTGVMVIFMILIGSFSEVSDRPQGDNRARGWKPDILCSSLLVELPEADPEKELFDHSSFTVVNTQSGRKYGRLDDYFNEGSGIEYDYTSVSRAREDGLSKIDLSGVDDRHAVLVCRICNVRVNGQEIYRDVMEDMQHRLKQIGSKDTLEVVYDCTPQYKLCLDYFSAADRFIYHESDNMTMKDYHNSMPPLCLDLVLSDENYQRYAREKE